MKMYFVGSLSKALLKSAYNIYFRGEMKKKKKKDLKTTLIYSYAEWTANSENLTIIQQKKRGWSGYLPFVYYVRQILLGHDLN